MFWRRFGKRTNEDPEQIKREQAARAELKKRIVALLIAHRGAQYTIRHFEQQLGPVSLASLSLALAELQSDGVVDRIIRVESPENHGGIRDYSSPDELPDEIEDWRTQRIVTVDASNTKFLFKAHDTSHLEHANA